MRREKALILSGCDSRPAAVAPAGSNRSVGGGNELDGASGAKGRLGRSASTQAVTRVNAEQASKLAMRKPTLLAMREGRSRWEARATVPAVPPGYVATACVYTGTRRNTGSPPWRSSELQRDAREGQARPRRVTERLVLPLKPVNAGGGKEPQFKDNAARQRVRRVA